jgi:endoglucanase
MAELARLRRRELVQAVLAAMTGVACRRSLANPAPVVTPPRLTAGVNLDMWFQFSQKDAPSDSQLDGMRRIGIDHVRLPVDPYALGWVPDAPAGQAPFTMLDGLDRAIARLVARRLFVNLDLHPAAEGNAFLKAAPERMYARLASALGFLIRRYAGHGEQRICFELMNEPYRACPGDDWNRMQARLIRELRPQAGNCWLVANGGWDPVTTLRTIDVYQDPRIFYAFHFYKPYVVTHQGASWEPSAARLLPFLDHVPYPPDRMDPETIPFKPGGDRRYLAAELRKYKNEGWGPARIRREMESAISWRASHQVPIMCTEFGVMRPHIDPDSRLRWLADVAGALGAAGIPWALWDYCTPEFGIARCGNNATLIEPEAARALGLRVS